LSSHQQAELIQFDSIMKNFLAKLFIFCLLLLTFLGFFSLVYELFLRNQAAASTEWILHALENTHFTKEGKGNSEKDRSIQELSSAGRQEVQEFLKIDLNKASQEELETLPRVGPKTAENIIAYRNQHGFFLKVSDLEKVKGLGPKTIQKMEPFVKVEAPRMSFLKKESKGKKP
jgi:comEA protein